MQGMKIQGTVWIIPGVTIIFCERTATRSSSTWVWWGEQQEEERDLSGDNESGPGLIVDCVISKSWILSKVTRHEPSNDLSYWIQFLSTRPDPAPSLEYKLFVLLLQLDLGFEKERMLIFKPGQLDVETALEIPNRNMQIVWVYVLDMNKRFMSSFHAYWLVSFSRW